MAVPALPFFLEPVHTEFKTTGWISSAGDAAKLKDTFWCSEFAGRSAMPKRIFRGRCNAMNDGVYPVDDMTTWGPGYTYLFKICGTVNLYALAYASVLVNWNTATSLDYYGDASINTNKDLSFSQYLPLQFENDGDTMKVNVGMRSDGKFYFKMEEGKKTYNDGNLDCYIELWVYEKGTLPLPGWSSIPDSTVVAYLNKYPVGGLWYSGPDRSIDMTKLSGKPDKTYVYVDSNEGAVYYSKEYELEVGATYILRPKFKSDSGATISLGTVILPVINGNSFIYPYTTNTGDGRGGDVNGWGFPFMAMVGMGSGYPPQPIPASCYARVFWVIPPKSWTPGAGDKAILRSKCDIDITKIDE